MQEFKIFVTDMWEVLRPFHKNFMVMLALLAVAEGLTLVSPYLFGMVLNGMEQEWPVRQVVIFALLTLVSSTCIIAVGHIKSVYEVSNLADVLDADLENRTLEKVQTLSIGQHRSQHSGLTLSVINSGRQSLLNLVTLALFDILPLVSRVIITLVALFWFNGLVGAVVCTMVIIISLFSLVINKRFYKKIREWRDASHRAGKFRTEILKNLELILVQAQEPKIRREFKDKLDEYVSGSQDIWIPYMKYASARGFMIELARFSVILIGIYLVLGRGLSVGDFVIIWTWTSQATSGIGNISYLHRKWMRNATDARKYLAILSIQPAVVTVANPVRPEVLRGDIEFRGVSFTYPTLRYIEMSGAKARAREKPNLPALSEVNFRIEAGTKVAFVGESGAGKSTIINLLIRGYDPDAGQVLVDGHDLRLLDLRRFRETVGVVEQNVKLFDQTLRYNILFGLNGKSDLISDSKIEQVIQSSRIAGFNHRLTNDLDTWLGEDGVMLSGGERQRVGIARAIIKDPRILIFDEATSSLDQRNERFIREAIRDVSVGRTTIIIAHRLSTVKDADKIFVMDRGQIVSVGQHEELCETSATYRELVQDQLIAL